MEPLRRVWHADRGRSLLRTPGPVPLGLTCVLLETNPFPNLLFLRTMLFEYLSVLSRFCIFKMLEFLVDNIFVVFCRKSLPADSRHSNGYELCPSFRRHLSVFIVFALNGE